MAVAGTLTLVSEKAFGRANYRRFLYAWTSHASTGNVAEIPIALPPGDIMRIEIQPVTSGGTQPTAAFDLTVADENGLNLLEVGSVNLGADLVVTGPTRFKFDPPLPFEGGELTPTITNAGNSKAGKLVIVLRP